MAGYISLIVGHTDLGASLRNMRQINCLIPKKPAFFEL